MVPQNADQPIYRTYTEAYYRKPVRVLLRQDQ